MAVVDLGPRLLEPPTRRSYLDEGFARFDGLWDQEYADRLSAEARALMAGAVPPPSRKPRPPVVAARPEPSSEVTTAAAPLLAELHDSLVPLARALTGRLMVAAWAVYIYYETDDAVWLHVDTEDCELTLLTTVVGDIGPLHLHPDLWGATQDELDALEASDSWFEQRGIAEPYPTLGVLAHRGNHVPHHRPHRRIAEPGAVAAMHYTSLF